MYHRVLSYLVFRIFVRKNLSYVVCVYIYIYIFIVSAATLSLSLSPSRSINQEASIRSTKGAILNIYGEITRGGNLLRKRFHEFHFEIVHVVL